MASRDEKKARTAIEELKEQTGKEAIYLELNLASLASVRKSAAEFLGYVGSSCSRFARIFTFGSKETELHVLYNNA